MEVMHGEGGHPVAKLDPVICQYPGAAAEKKN